MALYVKTNKLKFMRGLYLLLFSNSLRDCVKWYKMVTVYGCRIKLGIEEILSYVQRTANESIKEHVFFF